MDYPEHEKMSSIRSDTRLTQEFLDWLLDEKHESPFETEPVNFVIAQIEDNGDIEEIPMGENNREKLMALFFNIDLKKIEEEKRQMLKEIRKNNG